MSTHNYNKALSDLIPSYVLSCNEGDGDGDGDDERTLAFYPPVHTNPTQHLSFHLLTDMFSLDSIPTNASYSDASSSPEVLDCPPLPVDPSRSHFQLQTPLTAANWLMVAPSMSPEQNDLPLDDDRSTPQPLSSEPNRSTWSPESPPPSDVLDLDIDSLTSPSSSSSWSSDPLSDTLDDNYPFPLDWPSPTDSDQDVDYYMHSSNRFNCLDPILSNFSSSPCNLPHVQPEDYLIGDDISSPFSEEELLRSPVTSLRRPSPLPCFDDDLAPHLLPQTPSRRPLKLDTTGLLPNSPPSPRILTLPGAEVDDELLAFEPPLSDISIPPDSHLFCGLGLSIDFPSPSTSAGSPSPEHTNSNDLFSEFPELEGYPYPIPTELPLSPTDPDYDLVKLLQLCRKSKQAERDARRREGVLNERVASISNSLLPPLDVNPMARKNRLWELQAVCEMRAEARKVRKTEKGRWKEVRSLLRLKLKDVVRERIGDVVEHDVSRDVCEDDDIGKKWMMNDMGQVVAKMLFSRKDISRPLASRKMASMTRSYVRSPLAVSVHTAAEDDSEDMDVDVDEILDEMQGVPAPMLLEDIEIPPISD